MSSPGIKQRFGEETEQCVVKSISLHAAALHHHVDDSAHQNMVDGFGWRVKQVTEQIQKT